MDRNLLYRISVTGHTDAIRSIRSIGDAYRELSKIEARAASDNVKTAEAARKTTRKGADEEAKHRTSIANANRTFEKNMAKQSVREYEASEKAKSKAVAQGEKDRQRINRDVMRESRRDIAAGIREFENAEKAKTKAMQAALKERARAEANTAREMFRSSQSMANEATRAAKQRARDAAFDDKRMYRGMASAAVDGGRAIIRTAASGASKIAHATGVSSAYDVGDIVKERMEVGKTLNAVAIEARAAGEAGFSFNEDAAREKIAKVARDTGFSQRDLVSAVDVYSEKGSGATAITDLEKIARQAKAMGTSANVVAKTRAQIGLSAAASGQKVSASDMDTIMAQMHFIGKTGVFRAEDVAAESEALFSRFASSGMDFKKGFGRYSNFINEARKSSGSGAVARTSINAVQDQIVKKSGAIHKLGVKTEFADKDGAVHQRDFIDIVQDVIEKTGGDAGKLAKIFDPAKSGKALATLTQTYNAAGKGKGRAAMEKLLAGDVALSGNALVADMEKDSDKAIGESGNKMGMGFETVRQKILELILPALNKLGEVLPRVVQEISTAFDFIKKNPWTAGLTVAAGVGLVGMGRGMAESGMRRLGDSLVNTVPGVGGKVLSAIGGAASRAGTTPVWIVGSDIGGLGGGLGGGAPGVAGKAAGPGGATTIPIVDAMLTAVRAATPGIVGAIAVPLALGATISTDDPHYQKKSDDANDVMKKHLDEKAEKENEAAKNEMLRGYYEAGNPFNMEEDANGMAATRAAMKLSSGGGGVRPTMGAVLAGEKGPMAPDPNEGAGIGKLDAATARLALSLGALANAADSATRNTSALSVTPRPGT
jgi:ElaB/YqjD/DUF883 family membrane-anchored ribosome-binding protein